MPNEIGQLLIDYLEISNANTGTGALVYILLKEDSQRLEMCRFLSKNKGATEEEILAAAEKIAGENKKSPAS